MKTTEDIYEDLPLEIGKTYVTEFATKERFTVTRLENVYKDREKKIIASVNVYGIYEKCSHIGECPLHESRIQHNKKYVKTIEICSCCKEPL